MSKRRFDLRAQLASIPTPNRHVSVRDESAAAAVVEVELRYAGWRALLARVLPVRRKRRYRLDGIGLEVYRMVDGTRTFEDLIDWFTNRHKLTFFEARGLLAQYLQLLMRRGLIVIGVAK